MPTEIERLYQKFIDFEKEEANILHNNFLRFREKPIIENEENLRIVNQITPESALKSFFLSPAISPSYEDRFDWDIFKQTTGEALIGAAIRPGFGAIPGLKGYAKKTMTPQQYERIVEQEHPFIIKAQELPGVFGKYFMAGKIFAPLSVFIAKAPLLKLFGPAYQASFGAMGARTATWGSVKMADNISKVIADMEDPTLQNMLMEPLEASGWGAALGLTHLIGWEKAFLRTPELGGIIQPLGRFKNTLAHFLLAGTVGGAREGVDKFTSLLTDQKLKMNDVLDIATASLFTGIIESIGHYQLKKAWQGAEIFKHYEKKLLESMSEENAKWTTDFLSRIQEQPEYIHTGIQKLPAQFHSLKPEARVDLINKMANLIKFKSMSFSDAFNGAFSDIITKEAPKLLTLPPKPEEIKIPRTVQQIRYGHWLESELKSKGWEDKDISGFKDNKSFATMNQDEAVQAIGKMKKILNITSELEKISDRSPEKIQEEVREKYRMLERKEKDRTKYLKLIERTIPPELRKDVGREFPLIAYARPSEKAFRRDPFIYFNGYLPIHDGYKDFKTDFEIRAVEADKLAKRLKLTKGELSDIDYRRHLMYFRDFLKLPEFQGRVSPELNNKQLRFDNYLTKNYRFLHEYLGIKGKVPYHMYTPMLRESHDADIALVRSFFPEQIPQNIDAYMHHERTKRDMEGLKTNALDNYKNYLRSGLKKKYLEKPMRDAYNKIIKNPYISGTMKNALKQEASWLMGWPSGLDASYDAMFKDLGLKPDQSAILTRTLINLVYSSVLAPRGPLLIKQLLQNLSTANELGYNWTTKGLMSFLSEGFDEPRAKGVLLEYMPEAYREYGELLPLDRIREVLTWAFHKEDMFGRSVAYYTARNKWDSYYPKSKNIPEFMQKVGINHLDKTIQFRIRDALRKGNIDEAKAIFYKDIVRKVHYLYGKQDAPLVTKWRFGKQFMQLHTWPENLLELFVENSKNKHGMFFLRQLMAALFLTWLGHRTKQRWMVGYPVTALPLNSYRFERFINAIPVSLQPMSDLFWLAFDPAMQYLYSVDPEAAERQFKIRLKRLGRDALLYLPGGLTLRDIYRISKYKKPSIEMQRLFR